MCHTNIKSFLTIYVPNNGSRLRFHICMQYLLLTSHAYTFKTLFEKLFKCSYSSGSQSGAGAQDCARGANFMTFYIKNTNLSQILCN